MENWKQYEDYQISDLGNVKGKNGIILKPYLHVNGYLSYCHRTEWPARRTVAIHRIVAILFISNPENKREVNHKNGIKTDNRVENLEWATSSENQLHSYRNGLQVTKLNPISAGIIREAYSTGRFTHKEIANYFKVDTSVICDTINRKIWV